MKTLVVSDLDGTLLRGDARTSDFTNRTINALVQEGLCFSYATARSYHTARQVTAGLCAPITLIVYNGAFVRDNQSGALLWERSFSPQEAHLLLEDLAAQGVSPIVYAWVEGKERFSWLESRVTPGMRKFLDSRRGDVRARPLEDASRLRDGRIFYLTCIDTPQKLRPLYERWRGSFPAVYQTDLYTGEPWLELLPRGATKAHAAQTLKTLLGCERLIAFGDGQNDLPLFRLADECYAVSNAVEELKAIATGVIGSNEEDGVAHWLASHFQKEDFT